MGADVVIKDKFTIKGLSTAPQLWICDAIGIATGADFILESIVVTMITLLIVFIRNRVIIKID
ncbi:MAG: MgtC/SapB family protein [Bacilli bacterium]|nr:MgtC/SapB family protein [Bacilli bacterium]